MNISQAFRYAYYTGYGIRRAGWEPEVYVTVTGPEYEPMLHTLTETVRYVPRGYDFLLCDWRTYVYPKNK